MKRMIQILIICAFLAALFLYGPSRHYVAEKIRHIMAVKEQPLPKTFIKNGYEIRIKWEGTILAGTCKMQMIFTRPPAELYDSISAEIGRTGRVLFVDKEGYQVMDDYCDKDFFTIEKFGIGKTLIYRNTFPCSAGDYDKIHDARYGLDDSAGKLGK